MILYHFTIIKLTQHIPEIKTCAARYQVHTLSYIKKICLSLGILLNIYLSQGITDVRVHSLMLIHIKIRVAYNMSICNNVCIQVEY